MRDRSFLGNRSSGIFLSSVPLVSTGERLPFGGGMGGEVRKTRALGAAREELARRTGWQPCAPASFNTIVLPPDSNGTIAVYFLTPQTVSDSFPFGGHYEIDIAEDGHIVSARGFTRACLTLTKESRPSGAEPAALFLTHLLDPQPTEVHVFEQFGVGVPLYVGITDPRSVWKIDNGRILRVDDAKGQ